MSLNEELREYATQEERERATRPFRFEDLPTVFIDPATGFAHTGKRVEPESWGPVYDIKRQRGKTIGEIVRAKQISELHSLAGAGKCHVNIKADLKYKYSGAKARATCSREFHAAAARDRHAWATGSAIEKAYEVAMASKRARLACEQLPKRYPIVKPHYVLRDGKWRIAA